MFKIFNFHKPILPSKPEFYEYNNIKFIRRMPVKAGERIVYLNSLPNNGDSTGITFVTNKHSNPLGTHTYDIYPEMNYMYGDYMEVTSRSNRKRGYGEILRLASLMEMKENNINDIKIIAYSQAVPFHLKYRFKLNLKDKGDVTSILNEIIKNNLSMRGFKEKAAKLLQNSYKQDNVAEGAEYLKDVNKLVKDYVMQNIFRWESAKFNRGVPMILDSTTVKSNADFYNKLFKKHGIDYKI